MKYKSIKQILKQQIKSELRTLWQFDEYNKEFIQIYKNYDKELNIYTPEQLLTKLNNYANIT
tara:strand:+ start:358 stop:543 length:186 start_codon:yes stop_codon:yes gene_type:complete